MKRGATAILLLLAMAVSACQPDQPRRERGEDPDRPRSSRSTETTDAQPEPVQYRIFDQQRLSEPARATIHLFVDAQASRDELRVTLAEAINQTVATDSSLVALRAVGYVGRASTRGPREADLVPIAWAEWLPSTGWYQPPPQGEELVRRYYFYQGTPPEWGQQ